MVTRVLIVGGYGNFGSYIARALAGEANIRLIVAGRSLAKAREFAAALGNSAEAIALDIGGDLAAPFVEARPDLVIHTTGPFQSQSYAVAEACIARGCSYVDLADARRFVTDIVRLDEAAKQRGIAIVSGASSVPCLTAAIVDKYQARFGELREVDYGITAAQQTNRGLATTTAILTYVGKPFATLADGAARIVYGWQDVHAETYPELGRRWFGNCDIPDLDLFPKRYPELRTIRFFAGHEIALLHLGLWLLSWPVRLSVLPPLDHLAEPLLRASFWFDWLGSGRSGLHMVLRGSGRDGNPKTARFWLIARSGHGPYIPCMPAILLAKRVASGIKLDAGARPCLDLIDLDTYLDALKGLDISIVTENLDD